MRIVVAGSYRHWNALEKHYIRYLEPYVDEISLYPWPDIIGDYMADTYLRRFQYRFKLGIKKAIHRFNQEFYNTLKANPPNLVWVFKGVDLWPETIRRIKDLGVRMVNYNPDHPFIRTFRSGGGQEIEDSIPEYDLIFSYSLNVIREIERRFGDNPVVQHLPFGYDISTNQQIKLDEINLKQSEIKRICFIGNPDTELRYQILKSLIKMDLPIDIYGLGWNSYFKDHYKNATVFPGVYNDEYWHSLKVYRVQLNIFRPHNVNSHNMRTFEIPAVGGIQLAPDSIEHRLYFKEGSEIFVYNSIEEIAGKAEMLLNYNYEQAMNVRLAAQQRCLFSQYSYQSRAKDVYYSFKKLLGD